MGQANNKKVLYSYVKDANKKFIAREAKARGLSVSQYLDFLLDEQRKSKK